MGVQNFLNFAGLMLTLNTDNNREIRRLPNNTIPIHYNINLTSHLEEGNFSFYGESNVNIEIRHASSYISLHSRDLEINEAATTLINDKGTSYKPIEHTHDNRTDIITLTFDNALLPGIYIVNMKFVGKLISEIHSKLVATSFMKIPYTGKEGNSKWLATSFRARGARRTFPCWDEPALKATFDISITHHQKYKVLSNMPIRQIIVGQDSMVRTHFHTTPIMSTYVVAIVMMSNFTHVPNEDGTINMWCSSFLTSQVKFAHSIIEKVVPHLIEYTNSSKKIPKVDHVVIQNYPINSMQNWGLIINREDAIIYDNNTDPLYYGTKIASLIAHELAHEWFDNLVSPSWWAYAWLNEGLADFLGMHILNKNFENWRMIDFFVVQNLHDSLAADIDHQLKSVTKTMTADYIIEPESLVSSIFYKDSSVLYDKVTALLRMLHRAITDEIFQKGVITYLATHQFSSAIPDDLWNAIQSALDKSDVPHEGYRIKEVMNSWMDQNGYPVVKVVRNYTTGKVTISQTCSWDYVSDDNNKWWIPVTFATQSNPDFSNTVPSFWLRPDQNISFTIDPNDWIILNLQQTGYYRVKYDSMNWYNIIQYLNSDDYTNIHVLNRAQIIDDAFFLFWKHQMDGSDFIDLISYLSRETDYVAWYPMFRVLKRIKGYLLLPSGKNNKLRIIDLFDKLLQNMGYDENLYDNNITTEMKQEAMKWACTLGHKGCIEVAAVKLSKHIEHPDTYKILPWWQESMYCLGMIGANETTWSKMLELYQKKSDKMILRGLSCAASRRVIIKFLTVTTLNYLNTTLFNDTEQIFIFRSIVENHAHRNSILDYILKNFNIIKPRLITVTKAIRLILQNVVTVTQINKVKNFSEANINKDPDVLSEIREWVKTYRRITEDNINFYTSRFRK
ncbi:PREDICTED: aminopeptidase N-like isoform X2 [Wasmannia auropunctata]|uniref:aminopeptidase N-like isoform X2 n=1 Tax=Wasmannia auropunctata TaxID=64793 RepID=UPI0005F033D0|nr:PREDICTED: aminopeptidase N-like isoform X2 [Wasmannia auropunctata]